MHVSVIAGGHAPSPLEPAEAAFGRIARFVRLQVRVGDLGAGIARE